MSKEELDEYKPTYHDTDVPYTLPNEYVIERTSTALTNVSF
jgi:hypothetical protein